VKQLEPVEPTFDRLYFLASAAKHRGNRAALDV
jgi:hypothetical protein